MDPLDTTFTNAVAGALENVPLTDADQAAVLLACRLAWVIDTAEDQDQALYRHGPRLLSTLGALGLTPAARRAAVQAPAAGRLQELRAARG